MAQRNGGEIVTNYSFKACLWHGTIDVSLIVYLRYCDPEDSGFIDAVDTFEESPKLLRTLSLSCQLALHILTYKRCVWTLTR